MGEWLGTLGGAGMIALIAALAVRFMRDMGLDIPAAATRTMACAAATACAVWMAAGVWRALSSEPAQLLDVRAIWQKLPFCLEGIRPFNGYLAILAGAWVVWCARRRFGARAATLLLACPGGALLMLPTPAAFAVFAAALAARIALAKRLPAPAPREIPDAVYLPALALLALLNGAFIIWAAGV